MTTTLLISAVGFIVAITAHWAMKTTERRAKSRYREILGDQEHKTHQNDTWAEIRPTVGGWGCLTIALLFLRALGIITAFSATLYMLLRI